MTGTQKDSFLNSIGEGDGDQIVMWKRKAEVYLIDLCNQTDPVIQSVGHKNKPQQASTNGMFYDLYAISAQIGSCLLLGY